MDDQPIPTTNVPIVKTQTRTVTYEKDGFPIEIEDGILISSQSHSTRTQTIETTTVSVSPPGLGRGAGRPVCVCTAWDSLHGIQCSVLTPVAHPPPGRPRQVLADPPLAGLLISLPFLCFRFLLSFVFSWNV
mgnify:CR=1 FL=1